MFKFIIVVFISFVALSAATNVKRCKNGQPFPLSVEVEGCTEPPCDVIKGTTAVMDVHFVGTKNDIRSLNAKVLATALGITVPYELPEDVADVCSNLLDGATCPIGKDEDVVYKFNFHVDSYYPEIPVAVQVSLNDENDESVACFICDIKVKKGAN
ncbi:NPC intracellular cholesterol transporter 2-like [Calliphora vicina]|uniref:NPC intracellular cholesterol transporter 2-like n=1 Tax=Calliphora vicina TaxID=7373 RepID=UPI00325A887B